MSKRTFIAAPRIPFRRVALTIAVLATCGAAHAQQDTTTTAPDQNLDRVTVTGSNLRRADTETPSPVQVITLDEIKQSGYTDVSDVLHNLTANGAGTLSQSFGGAFAAGASGIALRGLTVGATLVLIDGHRMVPNALSDDGERSFVDVSQIPLEAIDRIEVLKDGASSIYGSDAIAGVINVILKKSYVGNEVSAEAGISKYSDGRMRQATGTFGFGDLDADGHNAYLALEYREQDPISVSNRPYLAQQNFTSQGGNDLTPTNPSALNGGLANSVSGYFTTPANTSTPTSFLPGCNATLYYANLCAKQPNNILIQTPTQNINVLGAYTQNLGGGWQLALKASLFDEHTSTNTGEFTTPGSSPYVSAVFGPGVSPTLYAPGGTGIITTVPTNYPGNKTGGPAYLTVNLPVLANSSEDSQNYRFAADLTGSLFGWDMTLSAGYSENLIYTTERSLDPAALEAALNNPTTPFRVGSAYGLNSAAAIAAVFPTIQGKATDQLAYVTAEASRDIYQLPGGPLSFGVGLDYRHQDLDAEAPPAIAEGLAAGNNAFAVGTQNVGAVYMELAAPIFKWLEVDASVRHDDYAGSFSNTDPKIGFKISPIEQIAFRGTYSEGFRAPNPAENGDAGESFLLGQFADPVLCPNAPTQNANGSANYDVPGNYPKECTKTPIFLQISNPNLKPETSHSYTAGIIVEPVKGYSVSLDYYNITIENQIVGATSDPTYFDNLLETGAGAVRGGAVPEEYVEPDGTITTKTPPVGSVAYYPVGYINDSSTQTSGVDLDARAKFDLWKGWGRLTFDLTETHVFHYVQKFDDSGATDLAGTHGPSEVSGDTGNPRDRAQFIVTYDRGPLTVTGTTNWTSGYSVVDPSQGQVTCDEALEEGYESYFAGGTAPSKYCRVKAFTEFDLYANYKITKALSVHASILNLFNQNAPLDYATYGGGTNGSSIPYQPSFAQYGAIGRYFTVGAQYRF
jgi:iron complex outermembrane receptor protein